MTDDRAMSKMTHFSTVSGITPLGSGSLARRPDASSLELVRKERQGSLDVVVGRIFVPS